MSTAPAHVDSTPRYLGDVLFTDPDVPHIPEQEWVEIVRAIAAGDLTAVRAIYDRAHALVFALILRITDDRAITRLKPLSLAKSVISASVIPSAKYSCDGSPDK